MGISLHDKDILFCTSSENKNARGGLRTVSLQNTGNKTFPKGQDKAESVRVGFY